MQKCYIWGTGKWSKYITEYLGIKNIEAFIESRPSKETYGGKKILSPQEVILGDEDVLIVASIYTIDICNTINEYSMNQERIVFCILDGVDEPIFYAANYGILRPYMLDEIFEKFIKDCGVEPMLYNAEFIRRVCEKYGLRYPSNYDMGNGVLNPHSLDKTETLRFSPNLHNVWMGRWFE